MPRMTYDEYAQWLRKRGHTTGRPVSYAESECDEAPALGGTDERETEGLECPVVRFTGFRVRPLDPDNFAGSVKDLLDGLRHAGLIPGDEPWKIRLQTEQVRVKSFDEEKTVIGIYQSTLI